MFNQMLILMKQELALSGLIFLLLILKLGKSIRNETFLPIIQFLLLVLLAIGFIFQDTGTLFDQMFVQTRTSILQKNILCLGVYMMTLLFSDWLKQHEHMPEFIILTLSVTLGMYFMISSGNLLMFYISLELSSIPLAAMVNFDLRIRKSSEAAMKMILSSAFSSGVLLLGISFVYGITGTIRFDELPLALNQSGLQILSFIFLFSAFAFKLSIVPFHFWTADVYEGAPVPVAAFLSVLSKAAMTFVLMNFLFRVFWPMYDIWHYMLLGLSLLTIVVGNLFALRQENIKRFLAFSSIAQVGFILLAISSFSPAGQTAVIYFVLVYLFSNMAAFSVAGIVCVHTQRENISQYRGFYKNNKFLGWVMALALFSLAGIPPTAGFFGKLFLLASGASRGEFLFILFAALNMVLSLYYYLKLVKTIFADPGEQVVDAVPVSLPARIGLVLATVAILMLGFMSWVYEYIREAV